MSPLSPVTQKKIMAIATLKRPIEEVRGVLKKSDRYYVRMMYGRCVIQKRPACYSEKQRAMRHAFGVKYANRGTDKSRGSPDEVP